MLEQERCWLVFKVHCISGVYFLKQFFFWNSGAKPSLKAWCRNTQKWWCIARKSSLSFALSMPKRLYPEKNWRQPNRKRRRFSKVWSINLTKWTLVCIWISRNWKRKGVWFKRLSSSQWSSFSFPCRERRSSLLAVWSWHHCFRHCPNIGSGSLIQRRPCWRSVGRKAAKARAVSSVCKGQLTWF